MSNIPFENHINDEKNKILNYNEIYNNNLNNPNTGNFLNAMTFIWRWLSVGTSSNLYNYNNYLITNNSHNNTRLLNNNITYNFNPFYYFTNNDDQHWQNISNFDDDCSGYIVKNNSIKKQRDLRAGYDTRFFYRNNI